MKAASARATYPPAPGRLAWFRHLAGLPGRVRRLLAAGPQPDKSLEALAAVDDGELDCLSESGLRLRREARRARQRTRKEVWAHRACATWLSAGVVLMSATQVVAGPVCRPALTIAHAYLSEVRRPGSERTWTAAVSVDAARCAPNSRGTFQLVVSRLKENGPELRFRERFSWHPPAVTVEVAFWADEALERSWIEDITPCPCAP